jgi:hypothetical protein
MDDRLAQRKMHFKATVSAADPDARRAALLQQQREKRAARQQAARLMIAAHLESDVQADGIDQQDSSVVSASNGHTTDTSGPTPAGLHTVSTAATTLPTAHGSAARYFADQLQIPEVRSLSSLQLMR